MDCDPIRDLEILTHVKTIATTHQISEKEAFKFYLQKAECEYGDVKEKDIKLYFYLKKNLSSERWELFLKFLRHNFTNEQLSQIYYQAKKEGKLKPAKLLVGGDFHLKNSDFLGSKYFPPGITLEAEVYDNTICHVWLSPIECEFVLIDELEFI